MDKGQFSEWEIEIDWAPYRKAIFSQEVILRRFEQIRIEVVIDTNPVNRLLERIVASVSGARIARVRNNLPQCG
jgi:hypothetical protein